MGRTRVTTSASIRNRIGRPLQAQLAKKAAAKKKTAKKTVTKSVTKTPAARQAVPTAAAAAKPAARAKPLDMRSYEKGLAAMHKAEWSQAKELLDKALHDHADEPGILDRVRSFLRLCERNLALQPFKPKTLDEFYELGVLKQNDGDFDDALKQFEKAAALDAKNDKVSYALAAIQALREERAKALGHLRRAIELNAENRIFAASDSDLSTLRDEVEFGELTRSRG